MEFDERCDAKMKLQINYVAGKLFNVCNLSIMGQTNLFPLATIFNFVSAFCGFVIAIIDFYQEKPFFPSLLENFSVK